MTLYCISTVFKKYLNNGIYKKSRLFKNIFNMFSYFIVISKKIWFIKMFINTYIYIIDSRSTGTLKILTNLLYLLKKILQTCSNLYYYFRVF